ncbi:MAG: hypothetical protein KKA90_04455 [Nanoarchaeota archaeon]|nr:hypothetical protein [Nanoarchaeota archaeon]
MRRGISQTLWIIVAAIVIMVTALVVLTIFGAGITPVTNLTSAKSSCVAQFEISCVATGTNTPPGWTASTLKLPDGSVTSCSKLTTCECTSTPIGTSGINKYTSSCT